MKNNNFEFNKKIAMKNLLDNFAPSTILLSMMFLMTGVPQTALSQVTGLSYSFSPSAEFIHFPDYGGIHNGYLFGGSIGTGFGQYVELQGSYHLGNNFRTNPSRIIQDPDLINLFSELQERELSVHRYGLKTKLNLSSRTFVPYLSLGAGLLRLKQNNLTNNRTLYYSGGAGIMTSIASRYSLFAEANRTGYRLNLSNLYSENDFELVNGFSPSPFSENLFHSWNFQAGVKAYIGGSRYDDPSQTSLIFLDRYNGGLYNTRFIVAPVYGQIYFNESLGMPGNQHFAGVYAGFEFGPHITLQGFYWKGLNDEESLEIEELTMYGAEFKSTFFRSNVSPYLTFGAGYLELHEDYRPELTPIIDSQVFGLAGLGVDLHISNRFTIEAAFKTMINSVDNPEPVSWHKNFEYSPMFTAGFSIKIGSLSRHRAYERRQQFITPDVRDEEAPLPVADVSVPDDEADVRRAITEDELVPEKDIALEEAFVRDVITEVPELSTELQIVIMREAALTGHIARAYSEGDSLRAEFLKSEREEIRQHLSLPDRVTQREREIGQQPVRETRTFTLPVLEEGEIYIRFGKPQPRQEEATPEPPAAADPTMPQVSVAPDTGMVELEATLDRLLDEYAESVRRDPVSDSLALQLADMELRLNRLMDAREDRPLAEADMDARFNEFESRILNLLERQAATAREQQPVTPVEQPVRIQTTSTALTLDSGRDLQGIALYTAVANPLQMLIGLRTDYGSMFDERVQILPEFVFGVGSGTKMYNINMNLLYEFKTISAIEPWVPYAGIGAGILAFSKPPENVNGLQLTASILLGANLHLNNGTLFAEYANMNLFSFNRLQIGYRFYF